MLLFVSEAALTGLVYQTNSLSGSFSGSGLRFIVASLVPPAWLFFSISFARANYSEQYLDGSGFCCWQLLRHFP